MDTRRREISVRPDGRLVDETTMRDYLASLDTLAISRRARVARLSLDREPRPDTRTDR